MLDAKFIAAGDEQYVGEGGENGKGEWQRRNSHATRALRHRWLQIHRWRLPKLPMVYLKSIL